MGRLARSATTRSPIVVDTLQQAPPDEATLWSARVLERTRPILPLLPTSPARATHDYERNGITDPSPPWTSPQHYVTVTEPTGMLALAAAC